MDYVIVDRENWKPIPYEKVRFLPRGKALVRRPTCSREFEELEPFFSVRPDLKEKWKREFAERIALSFSLESDFEVPLPKGKELEPHQKAAVEFIEKNEGKALISSFMGSGKTVSVLSWFNLHPETRPVLIVCPLSVVYHWKKHVEDWVLENKKVFLVNGKKVPKGFDFYVINWDKIPSRFDELAKIGFEAVIGDEAHYIKNLKAKRTKAFLKLTRKIRKKIFLTGTPLHNKVPDLFPVLHSLDPFEFPKFWDFVRSYCEVREKEIWDKKRGKVKYYEFGKPKNSEELFEKLRSTCLYRPDPEKLLEKLPPYKRILVAIAGSDDLIEASSAISADTEGLTKITPKSVEKLEEFFKRALNLKFPYLLNYVENLLEQRDKLVVLLHHVHAVKTFCEYLKRKGVKHVAIVGDTPKRKREEAVKEFQNDPSVRVFVGGIEAAGEGLTLTAARDVVFGELRWNLEVMRQAEMRILRKGQTRRCFFHYLVVDGTIEVNVVERLSEKKKAVDEVLEGKKEKGKLFAETIKGGDEA